MDLQLSLKRHWFEMTGNPKTEDYRDITPYWFKRLFNCKYPEEQKGDYTTILEDIMYHAVESGYGISTVLKAYFTEPKPFTTNTMTLDYPSKEDTDRIKVFKHAGIEIRTGRPEWGAEEGKIYFVIKHGEKI